MDKNENVRNCPNQNDMDPLTPNPNALPSCHASHSQPTHKQQLTLWCDTLHASIEVVVLRAGVPGEAELSRACGFFVVADYADVVLEDVLGEAHDLLGLVVLGRKEGGGGEGGGQDGGG